LAINAQHFLIISHIAATWAVSAMPIPQPRVSRVLNCKMTGRATMQMWNMWIVFTFIGLWHDLMWRWLAWAWLNVIFFSIELGIKGLVNKVFCPA
jgi:hypothetical protein